MSGTTKDKTYMHKVLFIDMDVGIALVKGGTESYIYKLKRMTLYLRMSLKDIYILFPANTHSNPQITGERFYD